MLVVFHILFFLSFFLSFFFFFFLVSRRELGLLFDRETVNGKGAAEGLVEIVLEV